MIMNTLARAPGPRTSRRPGHAPGPFGRSVSLAVLQPLGQRGRDPGLDRRLAVHQPGQILGGQLQEPARFGAADGGEPGVAVTAAPVACGELAEVVTGA